MVGIDRPDDHRRISSTAATIALSPLFALRLFRFQKPLFYPNENRDRFLTCRQDRIGLFSLIANTLIPIIPFRENHSPSREREQILGKRGLASLDSPQS